uniref:EF-hand calcium-binding protein n=1 Tax=Pinctada fucata TaxID=50426 RepID=A5H002_PINFU|nr:EF-hand calcium-binding protein [Pinctada fucata]
MKAYLLLLLLVIFLMCMDDGDAWRRRRRWRRWRIRIRAKKIYKAYRLYKTYHGKRDTETAAAGVADKCQLSSYDTDNDGKLSRIEVQSIIKDAENHPGAFEKFDADGDGHVSEDEFTVSIASLIDACQK